MAARKSAELGILHPADGSPRRGRRFRHVRAQGEQEPCQNHPRGRRSRRWPRGLACAACPGRRACPTFIADILLGNSEEAGAAEKTQPPPQDGVGSAGNKED